MPLVLTQFGKFLGIYMSKFAKLSPCDRFHDHLVNRSRTTAFEFFKEHDYLYPNLKFIQILHPFLECVKPAISIHPLSCLAEDLNATTPLRRFATNSPEFSFGALKRTVSKNCPTKFPMSTKEIEWFNFPLVIQNRSHKPK